MKRTRWASETKEPGTKIGARFPENKTAPTQKLRVIFVVVDVSLVFGYGEEDPG